MDVRHAEFENASRLNGEECFSASIPTIFLRTAESNSEYKRASMRRELKGSLFIKKIYYSCECFELKLDKTNELLHEAEKYDKRGLNIFVLSFRNFYIFHVGQ